MNKRCYNKIYCYFDEQAPSKEKIMKEIFVDYLKQKEENNLNIYDKINLKKEKSKSENSTIKIASENRSEKLENGL